jgi:hypothetical protein
MLLEQLDLAAHRRLGERQLLTGAGEVEMPPGGLQDHETVGGRQAAPQLSHEVSSSNNENYPD